jgi:serine O-acetyltransferase
MLQNKNILSADLRRYGIEKLSFFKTIDIFILRPVPGLKFIIIFRLVQYYRRKSRPLFYLFYLLYRKLKVKYGLDISYRTEIGKGLYIGHFGGVVIHGDSKIGSNCNISQGITIGISNSPKNKGCPTIGNNVFIGPGACIFGNIEIGDNVVIGANTVVTQNIPKATTVVNNTTVIIDKDLSAFYIHNSILK